MYLPRNNYNEYIPELRIRVPDVINSNDKNKNCSEHYTSILIFFLLTIKKRILIVVKMKIRK